MPKYDKLKKLYLPLNVYKTERTVSIATDGRKVLGGIGNEGLDIGVWIQERIDDGTIITGSTDISALVQLTGMVLGSTNLGTFTGSVISDNTTIKNALQELETFVEASVNYTDEQAQDAVGSILVDSPRINFTYSDASNFITADIQLNSVDFARLQQIPNNKLLGRYDAGTGDIQLIEIGSGLELDGDTLQVTVVPGSGTVTSVGLLLPSDVFAITNSPVTSTGTLTGSFQTQAANTIFAGPSTGANAVPTFRTLVSDDIPTLQSTKISDFSEAVDDRVSSLLVAGTNITLSYNDATNALTINATGTSYTDEQAQDAIGNIITDSATINFTYNDVTPSITGTVITQLSVTSDSSGVKLLGDVNAPGNNMYYGTDGSGTKGFFSFPAGSGDLPVGTSTQTLRYNSSNVLVANSTITNDGTNVGIGTSPLNPFRLNVNGAVRASGVLVSRGTGSIGTSVTNSELRLENTTSTVTWYVHSNDAGEMIIGSSGPTPELKIDTNADIIVANKIAIGNTSNVPDTLVGVDSNGYIGEIALGAGLTLSGGELSAPAGSLPTGTINGQILYWDGDTWEVGKMVTNTQSLSSGAIVYLPHVPISILPIDVYINGVLKELNEDYTLFSNEIVVTFNFISGDKVTTKYYI